MDENELFDMEIQDKLDRGGRGSGIHWGWIIFFVVLFLLIFSK